MRTNFQHAERVQVKVARVTWPGDTCDSVCCLIHLRHLVLSTCQLLEVTHMKSVVARECCRSVSSQSGRQLQLEPEASFIFLKNFRAFFTLKSFFWRDECFQVLCRDLHVSLGSEGF